MGGAGGAGPSRAEEADSDSTATMPAGSAPSVCVRAASKCAVKMNKSVSPLQNYSFDEIINSTQSPFSFFFFVEYVYFFNAGIFGAKCHREGICGGEREGP